jgi:GxxExxY protein
MEKLATAVLDAAFAVHRELGPGLLETVYEVCLKDELLRKGLNVSTQVPLPVVYKERKLEAGFRIDLLVENKILLELKSVEALAPIHTAQVITYLRLSKLNLAFLINFNEILLKNGIKRIVNNYKLT